MKLTINWLKDFLDFEGSLEDVLKYLEKSGLEIDEVVDNKTLFENFTVCYIKDIKAHPDAKKLNICEVETKEGLLQIVCGASNAKKDMWSIYAPVGAYLPAINITLKEANIRGVQSFGMLLSNEEMGLEEHSTGIVELDNSSNTLKVGDSALKALNLDEFIIDIAITPDRGDLLGILGIARELEAVGLGKLKSLGIDNNISNIKPIDNLKLNINNNISESFCLAHIINIDNNIETPSFIVQRLKALGQRSINFIVDITNYVCFSLNQPMHAYDVNKISRNSKNIVKNECIVHVDFAENNTKVILLDEAEKELTNICPVIKINDSVECVAGIKGALSSSCNENTKEIYLEAAHFNNKVVAYAKQFLKESSESSYRFERGIDKEHTDFVLKFAVSLILKYNKNAKLVGITSYNEIAKRDAIKLELSYLNSLSLLNLSTKEAKLELEKLKFNVKEQQQSLEVIAPSFRNDVDNANVLIAEIVRMHGSYKLPNITIYPNPIPNALDAGLKQMLELKKFVASLGFLENVGMSFVSKEVANYFGNNNSNLELENPISNLEIMRASSLETLIHIAKNNIDLGYKNFKICDLGSIYKNDGEQENIIGGIISGFKNIQSWNSIEKEYSVFDAKESLNLILNYLGLNINNLNISQDNPYSFYHSGRGARVFLGKLEIAHFGELSPLIKNSLSINDNILMFEIFVDRLPVKQKLKSAINTNNTFMPFYKDMAFIVENSVKAGDVLRVALNADKNYISDINIFDIYQGDNIKDGFKSVALRIEILPKTKVLNSDDIQKIMNNVILKICNTFKAELRDK